MVTILYSTSGEPQRKGGPDNSRVKAQCREDKDHEPDSLLVLGVEVPGEPRSLPGNIRCERYGWKERTLEVLICLYFILYDLGSQVLNTSALDIAVATMVRVRGVGYEGLGSQSRNYYSS